MPEREQYECAACGGLGSLQTGPACVPEGCACEWEPCELCDGVGITAIDCPGCGRAAVPIHETVFVAAYPRTYCEPCGDRELERIAARRGRVGR